MIVSATTSNNSDDRSVNNATSGRRGPPTIHIVLPPWQWDISYTSIVLRDETIRTRRAQECGRLSEDDACNDGFHFNMMSICLVDVPSSLLGPIVCWYRP